MVAYALENLNDDDEQNDCHDHDKGFVAVIAVVDGDFTKSAAADDSAHCRVAQYSGNTNGGI